MINDVLKILTWVFYAMAAFGVMLSVFLFFRLRIKEVIQDLNGTLSKEQIERMREKNMKNKGGDVAQELFDKGLGDTGNIGKATARKSGQIGETRQRTSTDSGFLLGSLQNQTQAGDSQNGTTVLKTNTGGSEDFVIVKNIVYINTAEFI